MESATASVPMSGPYDGPERRKFDWSIIVPWAAAFLTCAVMALVPAFERISVSMDNHIGRLDGQMAALDARFEDKVTELDSGMERKLVELDTRFGSRFDELNNAFENRVADMKADFEKRLAELDTRSASRIAELDKKIDSVEAESMRTISHFIDKDAEERNKDHVDALATVKEIVDNYRDQLRAEMEQFNIALDGQRQVNEQRYNEIASDVGGLSRADSELRAEIGRLLATASGPQ